MDVTITQFRKQIFDLANQALEGKKVSFIHKGKRLKVVPDEEPGSWLDRITPAHIINDDYVEPAISYQEEMEAEWTKEWDDFFDRVY